jgi:nucleotide-binding universal stress UspA family protein
MSGEVIVGYDGSECAKAALSQAVEQARAFGGVIVIGTHGERPLMGVVLGSTSYKLLHRSPVPLLVVRVPASGD